MGQLHTLVCVSAGQDTRQPANLPPWCGAAKGGASGKVCCPRGRGRTWGALCGMAPCLERCCVLPTLSCTAPCWGGELCQAAGLLPQTNWIGNLWVPQPCSVSGGVRQIRREKTLRPRAYGYQSGELVWVALPHSHTLPFSPISPLTLVL